jgi:Tfp pilus assembly protein PilF
MGEGELMAVKTSRMANLEAMIADDPSDPELRYFLAMEFLSAGHEAAAVAKLRELTVDSTYVPAFLQAGQMLSRSGQISEACEILRKGIQIATQQGNSHAQGEMQGLLDSLE